MLFRIQHLDLPDRPFFVLAADGSLTIDLNSSLFNGQGDLLGSYSYPGSMPLQPNKALIRNAHVISSTSRVRVINAMMWLGALPFKQVKMYFTIDGKNINYNLYYDLALISYQLKNLKMYQLGGGVGDGQLVFDDTAALRDYMTATTTGAKGEYPMVFFPWKNDGAYKDDAYVLTAKYNAAIVYNPPQKFLFTNNRVYQVTAATTPGQTPVTNPEKFEDITVYPDLGLPVSKIINRWELADDTTSGFVVDEGGIISQTIIPAFYLVYILRRMAEYFGFKAVGSWLDDDDANKIVVMSNIPISVGAIIPDFPFFMNDMVVSDFLMAVRTKFGLLIDPDPTRGLWIFESIANLESKSEVLDLQAYQLWDEFRETGTQSQAYTITASFDDKDTAFDDSAKASPPQLIIGDVSTAIQVTDIQMKDVQTQMVNEGAATPPFSTAPVAANWRVPYIKMPIAGATPMDQASTLNRGDEHGFGLRFLSYFGMKPNDGGYNYPYAAADNLDPANAPIGTYTLALLNTNGAFSSLQEYYRYMQASKPFEMLFLLPIEKFMAIANNKRIIVRDFNYASVVCLLDQTSADFANNKDKISTKLTLWPRIWEDNTQQIVPPVVVVEPPPPFDNGVVFVKLVQKNPSTSTTASIPHYTTNQADIYAEFYDDAAATTPKDVTNLVVKLKIDNYYDGVLTDSAVSSFTCTSAGHESLLLDDAALNTPMGGHELLHIYSLVVTADYGVV